jgi:DNA polymerase (family 10)
LRLPAGIRLRVDAMDARRWGIGLILSTGSEEHLQRMEAAGYNVKALTEDYPSEEAVYRRLNLQYLPPELREGSDEIDLAAQGRLPRLVTTNDICGELHAHSTSSDGADTIEAMAEAARAKGYQYIGITDHSQSLKIARGLTVQQLRDQIRLIDELNAGSNHLRILKGAEVDILPDGSLDYPDDLLGELDYTVCSIHSKFRLDKTAQTERLLRAMENRHCTIIGHATGRILLKRPGYEIDIHRVIEKARATGCSLELNATPDRLDLPAPYARLAGKAGVRLAISTDAHSTGELDNTVYGIDQARRAGLERSSVLNAAHWDEIRYRLKR